LHGGIAATALDEILVWAGLVFERVMTVTGKLELRYRRPVGINEVIEVHGRVVERRGRRLLMKGRLTIGAKVAVEASGLYLASVSIDEIVGGEG